MKPRTQNQRVLRMLERHPDGICAPDFMLPNVIDGGTPITRLAARIRDLRDQGEEIIVDGERHSCAVYKLKESRRASVVPSGRTGPQAASPASAAVPASSEAPEALFELVPQPRPGMYDDPDIAA